MDLRIVDDPAAGRPLDLLAVFPHPDDAELLCGGSLAKAVDRGHRVGILDLTRGEIGTRGTPARRAEEAACAARALGLAVRANAGLPDGGIRNDDGSRRLLVAWIRALRPRTVILPWIRGRHPDHRVGSELGRDACFLAGLARWDEAGAAHRPDKLLYALGFREDPVKPTFVVDISAQFERKMTAVRCYGSQFDGSERAGEAFPTGQPLYELIETQNRHYGSRIRRAFGEPFFTDETMEVDDPAGLTVASL